jgi:hypothetical protein
MEADGIVSCAGSNGRRIELGLDRAAEAVDSGAAKNLVKQWALLSNQLA